jgi:hypothetical protein
MQTQFCWIPGENYYNFGKICPWFFLIFVHEKNKNIKNLDLLYIQIHLRSIAEFWIRCVLCLA